MNVRILAAAAALALLLSTVASAACAAVDEAGAMALLKANKCMTCHSVDKKKDGPAYKEVAAKYKGDATAEEKLIKHVTEPNMVEIDGEEEEHGIVKTRDLEKIKNLVAFILSR
ncbi:MAG: class I cytochrome c [Lysobacterales bacterium CG02_land_8_20_14_3_00_62_12]|nr:MAG: class I cytochrome c [Xanthomonadales bacterium CG02_land_8_20_14_3_00_62_12]